LRFIEENVHEIGTYRVIHARCRVPQVSLLKPGKPRSNVLPKPRASAWGAEYPNDRESRKDDRNNIEWNAHFVIGRCGFPPSLRDCITNNGRAPHPNRAFCIEGGNHEPLPAPPPAP